MTDGAFWPALLRETFRDPRSAARRLIAANPPMEARWLGLVLVAVLSMIATTLLVATIPQGQIMPWEGFVANPWTGLPAQILGGVFMAFALARIGRFFRGTGNFADALLCIVWINAVQVVFMSVQSVLTLTLPVLGGIFALASFVVFFWVLSHFTCALHGFRSTVLAFFGIIFSLGFIILLLSVLGAVLGVAPHVPGA